MSSNNSNQDNFIRFALKAKVLSFGEFKTKAGRLSPYFFNAGGFNDGARLSALGRYYAKALQESKIAFDMLYGPAYKGITLAAATAIALADSGLNVPYAYNRKEAKDHGEGGSLVGAPVKGKVVIIDDVISAGTSVRESVDLIRAQNATPCAVLIALDRMEKSGAEGALSNLSAVQEVEQNFGMPVLPIANLNDLFAYLSGPGASAELTAFRTAVATYRERYGVA
jgi:orotate phosphoribosyltransferase